MTEKQKKLAIIVGTVILAIVILLWRRGISGGTIVNQQSAAPINVTIPGFNVPERSPIAINIPALPAFTPYSFNAISPCMCGGQQLTSSPSVAGPSFEYILNEGDASANVYNYYDTTPSSSPGLFGMGVAGG